MQYISIHQPHHHPPLFLHDLFKFICYRISKFPRPRLSSAAFWLSCIIIINLSIVFFLRLHCSKMHQEEENIFSLLSVGKMKAKKKCVFKLLIKALQKWRNRANILNRLSNNIFLNRRNSKQSNKAKIRIFKWAKGIPISPEKIRKTSFKCNWVVLFLLFIPKQRF